MVERKTSDSPVIPWIERGVLAVLLAITGSGSLTLSSLKSQVDVVIERQAHQAAVDERRETHEARIVAMESTQFTGAHGEEMRRHFDAQLLDLWRELHEVKDGIPKAHEELRDRIESVMSKLEARIRALENGK